MHRHVKVMMYLAEFTKVMQFVSLLQEKILHL